MKKTAKIIYFILLLFTLSCHENSQQDNKKIVELSFTNLGEINFNGQNTSLYIQMDELRKVLTDHLVEESVSPMYPRDKRKHYRILAKNIYGTGMDAYFDIVDDEVQIFSVHYSNSEMFKNINLNLFGVELDIDSTDSIFNIKEKISKILPIVQQNKLYFEEGSNSDDGITFFMGSDENYNGNVGFVAQVSFSQFQNPSLKSFSIFFSHNIDSQIDPPLYRLMLKQGVNNPADVRFDEE